MVMFYTTDESGSCMPPIPCHGSFSHPVSPFLPVLFFSQTELMTITVEEQEEDLFKCARSPMANSCKMTRGDAPIWMFSFWWKKKKTGQDPFIQLWNMTLLVQWCHPLITMGKSFGWFPEIRLPQIIQFDEVFHHKSTISGYPHLWNPLFWLALQENSATLESYGLSQFKSSVPP